MFGCDWCISIRNVPENDVIVFYHDEQLTVISFSALLAYYYKVKGFSSLLVCFAFILCHAMTFIRYVEVDITFGVLDCVRCIEDFVISRFVILRFCWIHCVVPENIHPHLMEGHWKFPRGGGVLKAKFLEQMYENKLEFPGGRVGAKQKPSIGGVRIFSGTAHSTVTLAGLKNIVCYTEDFLI